MREEGSGQITNSAWQAVVMKDRHYDGKFVYAAVTTRIYCRPSCPARNPHRRNTLIFSTTADAERQGYIACLRCHPNSLMPAERSVKAALDYIEAHLDQTITLKTLSHVSGLSPHHLQETFKRLIGLSPKSFCDARRIACFKLHLREGHSISNACYEVGFGSSRALYEKATKSLGMTPSVYRRGGKGISIYFAITQSALGNVLVARTGHGVCSVLLGDDVAALVRELRKEFPAATLKRASSSVGKAVLSCQVQDPWLSHLPATLQGRVLLARIWNGLQ
ncbi:MAG TPA: Ada metal-binding domain-containing protein [Candidatus Saccharimonadales bacterium]|nr:Ada metal-binding domain-containing protein [Candidatus Saccharimonadales bacterium]